MEWDDHAPTWDQDDVVRAYGAAAFESLNSVIGDHGLRGLEGLRVCDFGCGTGLLTEKLAPRVASIDAVDISTGMLAVLDAKIAKHDWSHVRTSTTVAEDGGPYDLVVASSVCAFLPDYPGMVADMAKRMAPGAAFVQWDWELDPSAEDPYGLSREAIRAALSGAGLEVLKVDIAFAIPMGEMTMAPLMGLGRKR